MQTSSSNSGLTQPRWTQIVPCLVATLWIAGGGVLSVHADRATLDPTRTQTAFPLATPPTIDGVIDTAEWGQAGGFQGNYWSVHPDAKALDGITAGVLGFGPLPQDVDDLSFNIYAGYDDTNTTITTTLSIEQVALSQIGGRALRLQVQKLTRPERFAVHSIGSNALPSCEPSQKGCDLERPQRHHQ